MACAAIRLARFNVENEEDETAHMSFVGFPTPAAAGVLASLVIFYEDMLVTAGKDSLLFKIGEGAIIYSLPLIAIGLAVLMIGRIRYPHLVNMYLRGRQPITHLLWAVVIMGMIFLFRLQLALVISTSGFALSGVVRYIFHKIATLRKSAKGSGPPILSVTAPSQSKES